MNTPFESPYGSRIDGLSDQRNGGSGTLRFANGLLCLESWPTRNSNEFSISTGFSMTLSGETFFSPVKSGIFLSNNKSARSNCRSNYYL